MSIFRREHAEAAPPAAGDEARPCSGRATPSPPARVVRGEITGPTELLVDGGSRARSGSRPRSSSAPTGSSRGPIAARMVRVGGRVFGDVPGRRARRGGGDRQPRRRHRGAPHDHRGGRLLQGQGRDEGPERTATEAPRQGRRAGAGGGRTDVRIGIPKEVKDHEYRVGMIPAGVHALVQGGPRGLRAGGGGGRQRHPRRRLRRAPAPARAGRRERLGEAEMVVKVKEPVPAEYAPDAARPDPLHLPAPGAAARADRRAARARGHRHRLRDDRGPPGPAAAA